MICEVCRTMLVFPESPHVESRVQPFVRFYGFARDVDHRHSYGLHPKDDERTYARRMGWSREALDAKGLPPHALDPGIAIQIEERERFLIAHPIACMKLECITALALQLAKADDDDSPWWRDHESFAEPTGTCSMRAAK